MTKHPFFLASLFLALAACSTPAAQPQTPDFSTTPSLDLTDINAGIDENGVEWYAYYTGDDESSIPQNTLRLKTKTQTRDILFETACAGTTQVADIPDLDKLSSAYIQCWWAGGGDQFAVFEGTDGTRVIKHRTVDEESGFGAWEELKTL